MPSASQAHLVSQSEHLLDLAARHPCARHPLFEALETCRLNTKQIKCLLKNYDAHASLLRRLLLKAATLMPEAAVGHVLENVRNEYGNGNYDDNHQAQLQDLAWSCGVEKDAYKSCPVKPGVADFMRKVGSFYFPPARNRGRGTKRAAAIAAGAISATEILAVREFSSLQKAFSRLQMQHHIWFHHVSVEAEHSSESLSLALFFIEHYSEMPSVEYGLKGVLDANISLYDGLAASICQPD